MSQQGGKPTGHEDDWWGQLYDESTEDTGPAPAADSLDDRFASAAGTVNDGAEADSGAVDPGAVDSGAVDETPRAGAGVPAPRSGLADAADAPYGAEFVPERAPWEPPPDTPAAPAAFPPGPKPPGFVERTTPRDRTSTESPVTTVPASRVPPDVPSPPTAPPRPAVPPGGSAAETARDEDWWAAQQEPATPAEQATPADPTSSSAPQGLRTATRIDLPTLPPSSVDYVGSGPPTYDAEPTALPPADPDELDDLVADTVLDGARYGSCTLRAVSVRGDSARFRGEPRRDSMLTARFGTGEQSLILVAMATGARATPGAHRAAAEACHWIGRAVGRSHARLAEDITGGRRGDLKSGLHRLTDRSLGKLRASATEQGIDPEEYAATLRCLLLPADPDCRTRVFFGIGAGGLFRLRDGEWHDIEPRVADITGEPVVGFGSLPAETPEGDRLTMDLGIPTPPSPYEPAPEPPREPFRFRASVARPGDTLLMCTGGLAEPLRGEPDLCRYLTGRWSEPAPPGLAAFLADTQTRVKGYADDRTAAAVWEA